MGLKFNSDKLISKAHLLNKFYILLTGSIVLGFSRSEGLLRGVNPLPLALLARPDSADFDARICPVGLLGFGPL